MNDRSTEPQPWIHSAATDLLFITGPAFVVSAGCLLFAHRGPEAMRAEIPLGVWILFVLGIDVAHVYSTLFRTYFDPEERERYHAKLWLIPIACWTIGVLVFTAGSALFWSLLAYLAVFHFVRQQYGFYALYARRPNDRERLNREIDTAAVYLGAIYPLVYWHEHLPRAFVWFVDGDFPFRAPHGSARLFGLLAAVALGLQFVKEVYEYCRGRSLNIPKNLIIWGTALSWYVGIVHFNGDVPFTITNVAAHGIPYITLIWIFGRKKANAEPSLPPLLRTVFSPGGVLLFVACILTLAVLEEFLWDILVWRDRRDLFGWAWKIPAVSDGRLLALLVPLLAVPQATHYVLDAFIWRVRKPAGEVNRLLLDEHE